MTKFSYTAHQNNHQLDLLGRPIKVGDRVLTKGYGSAAMNNFATVKAVHDKSITIDVEVSKCERDSYTGRWVKAPLTTEIMKRVGYKDVLVVNELEPISTALANDFINQHPEFVI